MALHPPVEPAGVTGQVPGYYSTSPLTDVG
jgi:hypothetical protein